MAPVWNCSEVWNAESCPEGDGLVSRGQVRWSKVHELCDKTFLSHGCAICHMVVTTGPSHFLGRRHWILLGVAYYVSIRDRASSCSRWPRQRRPEERRGLRLLYCKMYRGWGVEGRGTLCYVSPYFSTLEGLMEEHMDPAQNLCKTWD